jgi:uncharacterized protein YuzE
MKIKYDEETDVLYIKLRESEYYESEEIGKGYILDYDEEGNIIGIEILEASTRFTLAELSTVKFEISRQIERKR